MEDLVVELGEVALSNRENSREEQQTQKKTPLVSILRSPQILWLITMWPALINRNKLKEGFHKISLLGSYDTHHVGAYHVVACIAPKHQLKTARLSSAAA